MDCPIDVSRVSRAFDETAGPTEDPTMKANETSQDGLLSDMENGRLGGARNDQAEQVESRSSRKRSCPCSFPTDPDWWAPVVFSSGMGILLLCLILYLSLWLLQYLGVFDI